jgi:hypothetical protein
MSEAVTVSGTPTLKLNDGGIATYNSSASVPSGGILEFDYTVSSGQTTSDLEITGTSPPAGASIQDLAGNTANLTLNANAANLNLTIYGIPLAVKSIKTAAPSSDVVNGDDIIITLNMNEPVTVTGNPVLTLNDGSVVSRRSAAIIVLLRALPSSL